MRGVPEERVCFWCWCSREARSAFNLLYLKEWAVPMISWTALMLGVKLAKPSPLPPCLTSSSSQIPCKSARAIAMATESVILVCATASRDSTAWTAPKVLAVYKFGPKRCFRGLTRREKGVLGCMQKAETINSSNSALGEAETRWLMMNGSSLS